MLFVSTGLAQNRPQVSLETSETLFTVLAAINTCGYDQELNASDPLRTQIRSEVAKAVANTAGAQDVIAPMCGFYRQHQATEAARDLVPVCIAGALSGGAADFHAEGEADGLAARRRSVGGHRAADAGLLRRKSVCTRSGSDTARATRN